MQGGNRRKSATPRLYPGLVKTGIVSGVVRSGGYGFISSEDNEYWFHFTALDDTDEDAIEPGDFVEFVPVKVKGRNRGIKVRKVE